VPVVHPGTECAVNQYDERVSWVARRRRVQANAARVQEDVLKWPVERDRLRRDWLGTHEGHVHEKRPGFVPGVALKR